MLEEDPMRTILWTALAALALPATAAETDIAFVHPERFADVGRDARHTDRDDYLERLRAHLADRAARLLPQDERLEVRITDVDMAGDFEPWTGSRDDIRIFRAVDAPRIDLTFRLLGSDGRVRQEGERRLADTSYLTGGDVRSSNDPLRFEKALLDRWMAREFGVRRTAR
jgi:hypothetical protein